MDAAATETTDLGAMLEQALQMVNEQLAVFDRVDDDLTQLSADIDRLPDRLAHSSSSGHARHAV